MPLAFAALVFLPSVNILGKKIQSAAKGKGTSDYFSYLIVGKT